MARLQAFLAVPAKRGDDPDPVKQGVPDRAPPLPAEDFGAAVTGTKRKLPSSELSELPPVRRRGDCSSAPVVILDGDDEEEEGKKPSNEHESKAGAGAATSSSVSSGAPVPVPAPTKPSLRTVTFNDLGFFANRLPFLGPISAPSNRFTLALPELFFVEAPGVRIRRATFVNYMADWRWLLANIPALHSLEAVR